MKAIMQISFLDIWIGNFGNYGFDILTISNLDNDYSLFGIIYNEDNSVWIDVLFLNFKIYI